MAEDLYAVLGVEQSSTPEEIKKAYRKLAHQHHPDKEGGNEEKFKQINAAYQVLSDENKRSQYDQFGQTLDGPSGPGGPGGFDNMGDFGNVADIFEQFFGSARRPRAAKRGNDVAVDVTISFADAATGTKHNLSHRLHQKCTHCSGNGAEPGTPIKTCPTCQGSGEVSTNRQTMLGVITARSICPTCQGEGKQAATPCRQCRGTGRELKDRELTVDIPAGIEDGQAIRVTGRGEVAGTSGTPGDLYVNVHVAPHPTLTRDGNKVRSTASISFIDAALGTELNIDTLAGSKALKIPAGTQPGTELTLTGLGFSSIGNSHRDDQVVTINVAIPKRLSRQQKKLLNELRSSKKKLFS